MKVLLQQTVNPLSIFNIFLRVEQNPIAVHFQQVYKIRTWNVSNSSALSNNLISVLILIKIWLNNARKNTGIAMKSCIDTNRQKNP